MPLILQSSYQSPRFMTNGHVQTLYPNFFRRVSGVHYERERINTTDGDFLDLDWSKIGSRKLAIISHGLEGDSHRTYVLGMVRAFNRRGWDALAWNFRGCSGEGNLAVRYYHSGETEDVDCVIRHALASGSYDEVTLVGFSLGGNMMLKYLGEGKYLLDPRLKQAVAISVPCHLASSAEQMARPENKVYMLRFLLQLKGKIKAKLKTHPTHADLRDFHRIKTFFAFDDRYTAPIHGFKGAADYYEQASARQFLRRIHIPTLMLSARNDPFLSPQCFPEEEAQSNPNLILETPASGGHVGFISWNTAGEYWSESRTLAFSQFREAKL